MCKAFLKFKISAVLPDAQCMLCVALLFVFGPAFGALAGTLDKEIAYLHPLPFSDLVSSRTTIILRFEDQTAAPDPEHVAFLVTGSISGEHAGRTVLSTDHETYIFKPDMPFEKGEKVFVQLTAPPLSSALSFYFTISAHPVKSNATDLVNEALYREADVPTFININGVVVPSDFPIFKPSISISPSPGLLFLTDEHYIAIYRNDGTPYYFYKSNSHVWDFSVQPNGQLSFMDGATAKVMDDHFKVVDSYKCRFGYATDPHEFLALPDGHVLLIAEDKQIIDMSTFIDGGNPRAIIVGDHIQELDQNKDVIFEWRCWDNYNITDAVHENLKAGLIHAVHMNAIDVDFDGNLLVSSRHLDEITKINRRTGDIIWRLGGVNNQFDFTNDSLGFTYQHDIRAVPGRPNHYTLMDNGNYHRPTFSRGVEYRLDTQAMTAELVWQYRSSPDRYSHWMGNVQRLENGNTIIGWAHKSLPKITEVTPDGRVVYEGDFRNDKTCYRAHRLQWRGSALRPQLFIEPRPEMVTLFYNQFGEQRIDHYIIYAGQEENPVSAVDTVSDVSYRFDRFPRPGQYFFRVASVDSTGGTSDFSNQVKAYITIASEGGNQILNGDFGSNLQHWTLSLSNDSLATWDVNDAGQLHIQIQQEGAQPEDVTLSQSSLYLVRGRSYRLSFDAFGSNDRAFEVQVKSRDHTKNYSQVGLQHMRRYKKTFSFEFRMALLTDPQAELLFNLGYGRGDIFIDNISLIEAMPAGAEKKVQAVGRFKMSCSPNPFNSRAAIKYYLPFDADVILTLFDIRGRKVLQRPPDRLQAGQHSATFDFAHYSSGVYFCQMQASSGRDGRQASVNVKMLHVK